MGPFQWFFVGELRWVLNVVFTAGAKSVTLSDVVFYKYAVIWVSLGETVEAEVFELVVQGKCQYQMRTLG